MDISYHLPSTLVRIDQIALHLCPKTKTFRPWAIKPLRVQRPSTCRITETDFGVLRT
jgi:hypothetical protein